MALFDYRPQTSCGKVIFLHLSVILSTGGSPLWTETHPSPSNWHLVATTEASGTQPTEMLVVPFPACTWLLQNIPYYFRLLSSLNRCCSHLTVRSTGRVKRPLIWYHLSDLWMTGRHAISVIHKKVRHNVYKHLISLFRVKIPPFLSFKSHSSSLCSWLVGFGLRLTLRCLVPVSVQTASGHYNRTHRLNNWSDIEFILTKNTISWILGRFSWNLVPGAFLYLKKSIQKQLSWKWKISLLSNTNFQWITAWT